MYSANIVIVPFQRANPVISDVNQLITLAMQCIYACQRYTTFLVNIQFM